MRCDACPVLCRIRPGRAGACSRYANVDGALVRTDPVVLMQRAVADGGRVVAFAGADWDGQMLDPARTFVTGVGAGTTYPDYKPAPFIIASEHDGLDTVTVVTEGIFSYCGAKVKIDTDRHLGPEAAPIRVEGEQVGHVTTAEYGSQMLSIGGVRHLTGGSKKEGNVTCDALLRLCAGEPVAMTVDGGHTVVVQAGAAPIVDGRPEERMRVGCGSATVGIFARQWAGEVDEVIVVDDHITGVLTEHQAGRCLDMPPAGIRVRGRKSTPGRYFRVAEPGLGWGGTDITDPLAIIQKIDPAVAWPGLRLLLTSTTGEDALYCVLDEDLRPVPSVMPGAVRAVVDRIGENCEPSLCSVLFMAGAGGSLRAGVTENPVLLTRSVAKGDTRVTLGGAPAFVWPGGGITVVVDVTRMPRNAFGYVPTPAIVAPIEFTLPRALYLAPRRPCRRHHEPRRGAALAQRTGPDRRLARGQSVAARSAGRNGQAVMEAPKQAFPPAPGPERYVLEDQIGFRLRKAHQRATDVFNAVMGGFDVTPTQFAALAKLDDVGPISQNQLGRLIAMDPATIFGVVGRLAKRGYVRQSVDESDARVVLVTLTDEGRAAVAAHARRRGRGLAPDPRAAHGQGGGHAFEARRQARVTAHVRRRRGAKPRRRPAAPVARADRRRASGVGSRRRGAARP